ncbi:MAG TPA: hypothetical protein VNT51_14070, partial [Miltoncostaeaceae bacterium]|nr:hypothetical protein [Miltoncostaeaceae bacterium]
MTTSVRAAGRRLPALLVTAALAGAAHPASAGALTVAGGALTVRPAAGGATAGVDLGAARVGAGVRVPTSPAPAPVLDVDARATLPGGTTVSGGARVD